MPYALREAIAAFRRAPLLIAVSIVAVCLSLFVIGLFALTAFNVRQALREAESRVEVVAYLSDGATSENVEVARHEIGTQPEVLEVRFVSKTEALAQAVRDLPEFREVLTGIEVNPLPASLEIRLKPGYRTPESTERIAQYLLAYPFVEDAQFGREWVANIYRLQRVAAGGTAIIGGAFALVAGIIIGAAVRIGVFARREEIEIMRLVGATDGFIRRPFLIEGALTGLIGGLAAILLTSFAHRLIGATLVPVEWLPTSWLIAGVLAGTLYGLLASAVAVRWHLRGV